MQNSPVLPSGLRTLGIECLAFRASNQRVTAAQQYAAEQIPRAMRVLVPLR